jgi:hypothetical protein
VAEKKYRGIGGADRAIREGVVDALEIVGADLTGKAQRIAPKDEGTLRASARWEIEGGTQFRTQQPGSMSASVQVNVIFDVPYAEVQHENTAFAHTNGQARYLESPMKSNALTYRNYIERAIQQRLKRRL